MFIRSRCWLFALIGGILAPSEVAWTLPRYRVVEFPGFDPKAINESGEIAGRLHTGTGTIGAVLRDGRFELIESLGGSNTFPRAINDLGVVAGFGSIAPSSGTYPFIWDGVTHPLKPVFTSNTDAEGINDRGDVVGHLGGVGGNAYLVRDGLMTDLGTLSDSDLGNSHAQAINNRGQIVGSAEAGLPFYHFNHGFLWQDGMMHDLSFELALDSEAYDINELGQIAGAAEYFDGHFTATIWEWETGNVIDLGTLPGTTGSFAIGINNHTQVIGMVAVGGFENWDAFYWEDGLMIRLSELPGIDDTWQFGFAWDINDAGQIIADGCSTSGECGTVLLTPVHPADLDADGVINTIDLGILLSHWSIPAGSPGCRGSPGPCYADINGDGVVNSVDLGILVSSWTLK